MSVSRSGVVEALAAAALFGASTPLAKLLVGAVPPVLLATGPGSELQRPLAVVVIGGLFTSTLLTLVLLPTLYAWLEQRAEHHKNRNGDKS